jgi:hypothetical protein
MLNGSFVPTIPNHSDDPALTQIAQLFVTDWIETTRDHVNFDALLQVKATLSFRRVKCEDRGVAATYIRPAIRKLLTFSPQTLALWQGVFRIIPVTKNIFELACASD